MMMPMSNILSGGSMKISTSISGYINNASTSYRSATYNSFSWNNSSPTRIHVDLYVATGVNYSV